MRDQRHAPAALYPRERPGIHCTEGWVLPRAGLDRCGKSRPYRDHPPPRSGDRNPVEAKFSAPDRLWGPPSLLYNVYRVFSGGKERPGPDADPSPRSSAVGHERVELYLYSPYGPYGLYRASVPVQGCTLPYLRYESGNLYIIMIIV